MPIEASVDLGFLGFSSNSRILPVLSAVIIPKRLASSIGTFITAIVQSASFLICSSSICE